MTSGGNSQNGNGSQSAVNGKAAARELSPASDQGTISEVRNLLFGEESRKTSERILQMEDRFSGEVDSLRTEFSRKMSSLEKKLIRLLERESKTRKEQAKRSSEKQTKLQRESATNLKEQVEQLTELIETGQTNFEARVSELSEELAHWKSSMDQELREKSNRLEQDKLSRSEMGELLLRLAQELQPNS